LKITTSKHINLRNTILLYMVIGQYGSTVYTSKDQLNPQTLTVGKRKYIYILYVMFVKKYHVIFNNKTNKFLVNK